MRLTNFTLASSGKVRLGANALKIGGVAIQSFLARRNYQV